MKLYDEIEMTIQYNTARYDSHTNNKLSTEIVDSIHTSQNFSVDTDLPQDNPVPSQILHPILSASLIA